MALSAGDFNAILQCVGNHKCQAVARYFTVMGGTVEKRARGGDHSLPSQSRLSAIVID